MNGQTRKLQYEELKDKLEKISDMPKLNPIYGDFKHITMNEYGFSYMVEDWDCGEYVTNSEFVGYDEIDQPLEYFQKKFADEIAERDRKQQEAKLLKEQREKQRQIDKEINDRKLYEKLKQKYERNENG